jgi:hypothetical protein
VTIGALVENTSGMVAYRTRDAFTLLDPSGAVVPDKEQATVDMRVTATVDGGAVTATLTRRTRLDLEFVPGPAAPILCRLG